jgi:hypothetical protein
MVYSLHLRDLSSDPAWHIYCIFDAGNLLAQISMSRPEFPLSVTQRLPQTSAKLTSIINE